jgi:peptide/nickel transport system substrate-binding protein
VDHCIDERLGKRVNSSNWVGSEPMKRRDFVAATAAALVSSLVAPSVRAQHSQILKYSRPSPIANLDPHWSPGASTRIYALAVFDTLYGMGRDYRVYPQMVEGGVVEEDGRRWTLKLHAELRFHDGEPVLARDCTASILRWGQHNSFGQGHPVTAPHS